MNLKWVKIPSLVALQVSMYIKIVKHEPLKNITYLEKKMFFIFLGADFLAPKSGHGHEN